MIHLKGFSASFGTNRVLEKISFDLGEAERLSVIGKNGSGKSTLALALAGVIPEFISAHVSGEISCKKPGLIMQNPSAQFFAMTVREELGSLGLENAKRFGFGHLLDRSVFQLSEGEKQRINLAANISFGSETLLLDEPLELLDPKQAAGFRELLSRVKDRAIVWFDKDDPNLVNSKRLFLGRRERVSLPPKKPCVGKKTVLEADISVERGDFSLSAEFSLKEGEKAALIGLNGSGKSFLLKAVAGIEKFEGKVSLEGRVGFVPQNPSHLFFNETAEAELAIPENASRLGIAHLLRKSPNALSKGQQKLLSLATVGTEDVSLLDEPTTWLDAGNRALAYRFISESRQAMLIATHDKAVLDYCDRVFMIKGGELGECSSTAANRFFRG